MNGDWLFETESTVCNFRCAGVVKRNGKVLLQRDRGEYALIGGQVKAGETGAETVVREFREELGIAVCVERMLWSEECFWTWRGRLAHTISFYYQVKMEDENAFPDDGMFHPQRDNSRIEIGWVPVETLNELVVYPDFLKHQIHDLQPGHFITRG